MVDAATTYDEVPYLGLAYWFTHPDHLGVMGALRGLDTAPSPSCRVLEIGCGDGGNLLSLAALLPGAHFVGIDLSALQISDGQRMAERLGLDNITLHHADLSTFEVTAGSFDYVIAHGVYGWVAQDARDGLMRLTARALAPSGVALISYNTLPGQSHFEPLRQLMREHTASTPDGALKLQRASEIAAAWCEYQIAADPQGRAANTERVASIVLKSSAMIMRHDYLEETESPVWFEDFVQHAAGHGLVFLDNALPSGQRPELLEPEARDMLLRLDDPIRAQQYLDFFEDTRFRVTLLARADAPRVRPTPLSELWLEDRLDVRLDGARPRSVPRVVVDTASGKVELGDIATRIALAVIVESAPRPIAMRALCEAVMPRLLAVAPLDDPPGQAHYTATEAGHAALLGHLEAMFVDLWRRDIVHLWRDPPATRGARERAPPHHPETGLLQRTFATLRPQVPSLYHRHTQLDEAERDLLGALDGTLDLDALVARFGPDTIERLAKLRRQRLLFD